MVGRAGETQKSGGDSGLCDLPKRSSELAPHALILARRFKGDFMAHRMLRLLTAMAVLAAAAVAYGQATSQVEINHLLDFVDQSGCRFFRNGAWYDSHRARAHLEQKRDYLAMHNMLPTTESFIQRAASESSLSGKPYLVQCGNGPNIASGTWLMNELTRFRESGP